MGKIIELLGVLAPFAGIAVLVVYRRRAPGPAALGMAGAALAGVGSLAGLLGDRVVYFGGGGAEGMLERLEGWGLIRLCLVIAGAALLVVAGVLGAREGRAHRGALIGAALVCAGVGVAMRFVHLDLGDRHGLQFFATMALETVQFGLLGLGILLLCIAVVSRRGDDGRTEPLALARDAGMKAWQAYQQSRQRG